MIGLKKKIVMYFPYAALYRAPIYKMMDEEFNCEWHFCSNASEKYKLKYMDYSDLKKVNMQHKEVYLFKNCKFSTGLNQIQFPKNGALILPGNIWDFSTWILMIIGKIKGRKAILWTHGFYGKESKTQIAIKKIYYHLCGHCLVYGHHARNLMIEKGIIKEDNISVIYNSLDYSKQIEIRSMHGEDIVRNHFENDNRNIVFVGRLTKVKKLQMILDALAKLQKRHEEYNMIFIGTGPEEESLKGLSNKYGLDRNIWFYGACYDEKEIGKILNNCDLCVSPGNVGLTAIHMLTYGVPVITNNNFNMQMPEFESIYPGVTGDFFDEDSLDSLTDTISNWFKFAPQRNDVKKRCYEVIDNFWNPNYQMKVLKQVIEG